MRWIFKCLFCIAAFYGTYKFCYRQTAGFTMARISSDLDFHPEWEIHSLDQDVLLEAIGQTFSFLGSGGQCFAFVSEDDKFVLKFYKHDIRRLPFYVKYLPYPKKYAPRKELQKDKRLKKLFRDFNSFKLAYEHLKDETGLLYVHLNKTDSIHRKVMIYDKLHIAHQIELDNMVFILQKKANMAYPYLHDLTEKKDLEKAKQGIQSICSVILSRSQKGIYDEDAKIHRNFGFIDDHAIIVDVGRLRMDEQRKIPSIQKEDLDKITRPFEGWLNTQNAELGAFLRTSLKATYENLDKH